MISKTSENLEGFSCKILHFRKVCFFISPQKMIGSQAKSFCERHNATLPNIETYFDQTTLLSITNEFWNKSHQWITIPEGLKEPTYEFGRPGLAKSRAFNAFLPIPRTHEEHKQRMVNVPYRYTSCMKGSE